MKPRPATLQDLEAITMIYNDAILRTTATFDTTEKTVAEQEAWFNKHNEKYPITVAEEGGQVRAWASLSPWSDRCAYADTAEVSVYVAQEFRGQGLGKTLLRDLIERGQEAKLHTLISRIAGESEVSIRLHSALGFFHIGTMREVGNKFGRLLDVHLMQRML